MARFPLCNASLIDVGFIVELNYSIGIELFQEVETSRIMRPFLSYMSFLKLFAHAAFARTCLGLLCFFASLSLASAQQRPLLTEDVDIIPPGSLRIQVGVDFMQNAKFPVSGLTGDLTRVGVIGINVGLAPNVELQINGVLQNFLSVNSVTVPSPIPLGFVPTNTISTNDVGDFSLATKIKVRNETKRGPSIGIRFGVQLPNSNQARGIGLNTTNAFGSILFGKKFGQDGRVNTFGNLGLAILTAPTALFTQNDVLTYGFGSIVRLTNHINFAGEINGRANTRPGNGPLGTESQSEARMGVQVKASGLRFDFAGIAGLTNFSPRSGVTFGVTYDTPVVFAPAK